MSQICFDRDIFGTSMGIFRTFLQHFRDIFTRKPIRHCGPGFGRRQCLLLFPFNCCLKSELLLPLTLGTMAKFDWYARLRQYDYPIWFTSYKLDYGILGNTQWAFSRIFCTEKNGVYFILQNIICNDLQYKTLIWVVCNINLLPKIPLALFYINICTC